MGIRPSRRPDLSFTVKITNGSKIELNIYSCEQCGDRDGHDQSIDLL